MLERPHLNYPYRTGERGVQGRIHKEHFNYLYDVISSGDGKCSVELLKNLQRNIADKSFYVDGWFLDVQGGSIDYNIHNQSMRLSSTSDDNLVLLIDPKRLPFHGLDELVFHLNSFSGDISASYKIYNVSGGESSNSKELNCVLVEDYLHVTGFQDYGFLDREAEPNDVGIVSSNSFIIVSFNGVFITDSLIVKYNLLSNLEDKANPIFMNLNDLHSHETQEFVNRINDSWGVNNIHLCELALNIMQLKWDESHNYEYTFEGFMDYLIKHFDPTKRYQIQDISEPLEVIALEVLGDDYLPVDKFKSNEDSRIVWIKDNIEPDKSYLELGLDLSLNGVGFDGDNLDEYNVYKHNNSHGSKDKVDGEQNNHRQYYLPGIFLKDKVDYLNVNSFLDLPGLHPKNIYPELLLNETAGSGPDGRVYPPGSVYNRLSINHHHSTPITNEFNKITASLKGYGFYGTLYEDVHDFTWGPEVKCVVLYPRSSSFNQSDRLGNVHKYRNEWFYGGIGMYIADPANWSISSPYNNNHPSKPYDFSPAGNWSLEEGVPSTLVSNAKDGLPVWTGKYSDNWVLNALPINLYNFTPKPGDEATWNNLSDNARCIAISIHYKHCRDNGHGTGLPCVGGLTWSIGSTAANDNNMDWNAPRTWEFRKWQVFDKCVRESRDPNTGRAWFNPDWLNYIVFNPQPGNLNNLWVNDYPNRPYTVGEDFDYACPTTQKGAKLYGKMDGFLPSIRDDDGEDTSMINYGYSKETDTEARTFVKQEYAVRARDYFRSGYVMDPDESLSDPGNRLGGEDVVCWGENNVLLREYQSYMDILRNPYLTKDLVFDLHSDGRDPYFDQGWEMSTWHDKQVEWKYKAPLSGLRNLALYDDKRVVGLPKYLFTGQPGMNDTILFTTTFRPNSNVGGDSIRSCECKRVPGNDRGWYRIWDIEFYTFWQEKLE